MFVFVYFVFAVVWCCHLSDRRGLDDRSVLAAPIQKGLGRAPATEREAERDTALDAHLAKMEEHRREESSAWAA